jgi:hypothetical protein
MRRSAATYFIISVFMALLFGSGCNSGRPFSSTYHSRFFGLYKPKATKAPTPQAAFATRFHGMRDPFSRHSRPHAYRVDGDGYHSVVRRKRHDNSMGAPANSRKRNSFLQRKTRRRRNPAAEDKKIFGKYQRKARKNHKR